MPTIVGVRVHFNDTRPPVLHSSGRKWYAEEDGYLRITDENVRDVAVHASMDWAWAELVHGEPVIQDIAVGRITFGGATTVPPPEQSVFTWPYDPTSGTVSTDDAVEQAKHEAADHISKARVDAAAKAVRDAQADQASAMRRYAQAIADAQRHLAELHDELDDAA